MNKENINKNRDKEMSTPDEKNLTESTKNEDGKSEVAPEELIKELEDKLTRTLAEMENQRRRYE